MAWSFEGSRKWAQFHALAATLWRADSLAGPEWREISALLPADWALRLPESSPRQMILNAEDALERHLGFRE